jgi:RNA polymerase sporulation-specific sigma factor
MTKSKKTATKKKRKKEIPFKDMDFPDLVDIVKSRGRVDKNKVNAAYNEIQSRMKIKIGYLVHKFYIPGHTTDDVNQEALLALRYKAIPDYKKNVIGKNGPYPFDKFAVLCIRRHLSTLLKTCYQNKQKTLNTSLSLDQDRNESSEEALFLVDIIPRTEGNILEEIGDKEYYKFLFNKLYERLSKFEKQVFLLYAQKYSYEEIAVLIHKRNKRDNKKNKKVKDIIKSVDNALSRMKQKAKEVFKQHGDGE